jgi:hypothetical protein
VAWFSHLLDAYDPGRLGRAVDVRPTALDHASRKAVPTMPVPTTTAPRTGAMTPNAAADPGSPDRTSPRGRPASDA